MKVPDTKDTVEKCICPNCPSYNDCMKQGMEGLYCARGKTDCDLKRQGCVCPRCPVAKEYQLLGGYYCIIGGWEEDLGKAIKTLAGVTLIPLKVAADVAGDIGKNLETAIPQPSELVSALIALRISTLKTATNAIEKEIALLEQYKGDLEAKEGEKKETVKVE